ncbi:MAG: IS1595 family transposase [Paenibacillaceae bacterium]
MSNLDIALATLIQRYRNELSIPEWQAFQEQFAVEEDAIAFLIHAKWPNGFRCPRCSHTHAYVISSRRLPLYQCHSCNHQTSLTVGTIMENSRTPMLKWLTAFFFVSRTDSGINAVQLQERINVTYKTSWSMLHVIRQAISKIDNNQPLSGTIRGGIGICSQLPYSPTSELHPQEKPVLIGATIDEHEQPVIIKMKLVNPKLMRFKHLDYTSIQDFTERHIEAGTEEVQLVQRVPFNKFRSIKNIFELAMIRLTHTFKGLTSRYLQLYLDEACYRINLSLQNKPIFDNLTQLCLSVQRH